MIQTKFPEASDPRTEYEKEIQRQDKAYLRSVHDAILKQAISFSSLYYVYVPLTILHRIVWRDGCFAEIVAAHTCRRELGLKPPSDETNPLGVPAVYKEAFRSWSIANSSRRETGDNRSSGKDPAPVLATPLGGDLRRAMPSSTVAAQRRLHSPSVERPVSLPDYDMSKSSGEDDNRVKPFSVSARQLAVEQAKRSRRVESPTSRSGLERDPDSEDETHLISRPSSLAAHLRAKQTWLTEAPILDDEDDARSEAPSTPRLVAGIEPTHLSSSSVSPSGHRAQYHLSSSPRSNRVQGLPRPFRPLRRVVTTISDFETSSSPREDQRDVSEVGNECRRSGRIRKSAVFIDMVDIRTVDM